MILDIDGVSFSYRSKSVLDDVTLSVDKGEILAILGPNGVGKSTMMRCIDAIYKPQNGIIHVDDEDVHEMSMKERSKHIAYVTQENEPSRMKVFESVLLGRKPYVTLDASPKDMVIAQRVISLMGIDHLSLRYMDEISGGERQLVQIARAIVQQPSLLLLDEPTSNLDLKNQYEVLDIVCSVVKANDMAAVMVIHDINLALRFSDRIVMMKNGTIQYAGDRSIVNSETVSDIYGIDAFVEDVRGARVVIPMTGGDSNES